MIIIRTIGGLGNQLFQYSLGRYLASRNSTDLYLDLEFYEVEQRHPFLLNKFNCSYKQIRKEEIEFVNLNSKLYKLNKWTQKLLPYNYRSIISSFSGKFLPEVKKATPPVYIEGYWQSEKYFDSIESKIRKEFQVKNKPVGFNDKLIKSIKSQNSVSIHIRRGDYISNPDANKKHGVCSMDYYERAINLIRKKVKNPTFYIFSDDKKWISENFNIPGKSYYMNHNSGSEAHEDLRLMSLCKHNIIANSTFSWWGAWLNSNPHKLVYAPKNWYKGQEEFDPEDLIPDSWNLL